MSKQKKWKIKGLKKEKHLTYISNLVLSQRLNSLTASINEFFQNESVESLHEVRIALRRLRYNMEIFDSCFEKKKFISFYKEIAQLQDLTGSKRDLDVLQENIKTLTSNEGIAASDAVHLQIEDKKSEINERLKLELLRFIHSELLKDFTNLLK